MYKIISLIIFVFLVGCSNKDVFIPKDYKEKTLKSNTNTKILEDYTKDTVTLKELHLKYVKKSSFIDNGVRGELIYYDDKGNRLGKFIKIDNDLAKNGSKLLLIKEKKVINLPYMIASAKKRNNLIAIVFENNAIGIYGLNKNSLIFYQENEPVIVAKYLKAKPIFYNDLVLFPLLNGKVGVYDLRDKKFIRNIDLSSESIINNIIFLKIVNNQLFMATPEKIVLFDPNYLIDFKGDIKHIISLGSYLYVFMVDGKIIKFDTNLKKIKEVNLPFADFFAPGKCGGNIYTVTSNKYLVKITPELNITIYKGNNFDTNSPLRINNCKIYNSNKVYFIE